MNASFRTLPSDVAPANTNALSRVVDRMNELDRYRLAVEQQLGLRVLGAQQEVYERFFEHVERCFDWGVSAAACARTWVRSVER
jgi:hypothetical protein